MYKYKILLTGKNKAIIDDFFEQMWESFTCMSTSIRYPDMTQHVEIYQPDLFVLCLNGEDRNDLSRIIEMKRILVRKEIKLAIIGSKEDCENFQKVSSMMADIILTKPISADDIREQIVIQLREYEQEKKEMEEMRAKLEKIREQERRKHILVIDDDPMMLKIIKDHLHEDYDVATAISGKIAHKFLESKKTDLILLDYEMPVENGPEVLNKLRENPETADIPVVFLTGITDKEKIKQALIMKPQGYLLKPIDKEKLLGTIEKFFG